MTGWPGPGRPAHADRPARRAGVPGAIWLLGGAVGLAALGLGVAACFDSPGSSTGTPTSASLITVTPDAVAPVTALTP